jgi:transaldolase
VTLLDKLKVKIFSDGADIKEMIEMNSNPIIKGLTTNPTLIAKAGVTNYREFAREVLSYVREKPISFEVLSDDLSIMENQAIEISSWSENVYVKIPITNTHGISTAPLIKKLSSIGIKVNVTAIMTAKQVDEIINCLDKNVPSYISIFAGRIADTGRDPLPMLVESISKIVSLNCTEVIWASPRELLNIFQADKIGCHIITVTTDILKKLNLVNYDLEKYSLDTVKMFFEDAKQSNLTI